MLCYAICSSIASSSAAFFLSAAFVASASAWAFAIASIDGGGDTFTVQAQCRYSAQTVQVQCRYKQCRISGAQLEGVSPSPPPPPSLKGWRIQESLRLVLHRQTSLLQYLHCTAQALLSPSPHDRQPSVHSDQRHPLVEGLTSNDTMCWSRGQALAWSRILSAVHPEHPGVRVRVRVWVRVRVRVKS